MAIYVNNNQYYKAFYGIICIAFVLRLLFVVIFFHSSELREDSPDYVEVASNVISGNGFTTGISNQFHLATTGIPKVGHVGPGWPLIIAPFMLLGDRGIFVVRLLNIIFGTASVFLAMIVARRYFKRRFIELSVGLIMSFHPFLIHYTGYLLTETVSVFLFTLYVFILTNEQKTGNWILSGLVLGYLVLVRGSFFLYIFPSLLMLTILNCNKKWYRFNKTNVKIILLHTLPFILILAPWTIRNYEVFDEFLITPTVGGGVLIAQMGIKSNSDWSNEEKEIEKMEVMSKYWTPENPAKELKDSKEFSEYGWGLINNNINNYLLSCVENFNKFWSYNLGTFQGKHINSTLAELLNLCGKLIQVLILVGIVFLLYEKQWIILSQLLLPIGYLTGIHTLLIGMKRYRLPVEPLIIIIACLGFYKLFCIFKAWHKNGQRLQKTGEVN